MSGARHRQKGDRIERELIERHTAMNIAPPTRQQEIGDEIPF
jgi:hypothetical protein